MINSTNVVTKMIYQPEAGQKSEEPKPYSDDISNS